VHDATLADLAREVVRFRDERDWKQFHRPKEMAISLALEAGELLELMQWRDGAELEAHLRERRDRVGEELADVLYWVVLMAHDLGIDLTSAFRAKMSANAAKYPLERARGSSRKYTEL
jgi:NTP pyrophosphatase (non-canonical NTP hydrolase)